ncbi:conserved oligomeric Golgi complex subunit 8 [Lucilia cuprina]|uniref:conserved oligomeric Golgi complex subunit 8 n=1 Tax=Lucilia cuprina TaxID=7375 RepID=UPI001F05E73C|nr:conserved oligomeric Golgi complex subunit 8 [Lucilia cuprina]XP_023298271.2 conserved oligomeric Golgi complex subunit 8 [Lucilia cuprina]XP_046812618.1 conserved oligomeric Golgi complex subunit 8 [Lucilia cuprina]
MDLESERILKLIFPDGVPENLRDNPELFNYLNKLGTYKVDQLKKEQTRLTEETKHIVEQTQDLAISNYKTFIKTAENSRSIYSEFKNAESQVETLIDKLPQLIDKCENFQKESLDINEQRRLNTITLKKNAQLLEILELPQLMERCIREGRYEEALELASYVQKMGENQGHIPIIKSIVNSVELLWHTMLVQLVAQLRTDLQLPKCLQIVGYLRRMQAFGTNELKLKFLQARDAWLTNSLKAIPMDDAQQHLTKTIEVTRVNLFNIINQYKAIFPEEDELAAETLTGSATSQKPLQGVSCDGSRLFQSWLHEKITDFLKTLEFDLQRGIVLFDTVLGQCMYFGLSFSRVGADFRALMVPIFVKVIKEKFLSAIAVVNQSFEKELQKYTLINKVTVHNRNSANTSDANDLESYSPPETLLDFHPLAALCNGYLNALNDLRLCAPTALANDVTNSLQQSLEMVAKRILSFYRQEQQAFTANERDTFTKLCACFAYDLIPYLQRCIHAIFPPNDLSSHLGVNLNALENTKITYLQQKDILEPLKHLLPNKVETFMKSDTPKAVETNVAVTAEG